MRTPLALLILACSLATGAAEVAYQSDFKTADLGTPPKELTIVSGDFSLREEGGRRFLELPGAPLESFGLLFGPSLAKGGSAGVTVFASRQGRKSPVFGVSLRGVSGYRLQVSPGKRALEIFKGDEARASVAFEWTSGVWTRLRLQVRPLGPGVTVEGKAWKEGGAEPAAWMVSLQDPEPAPPGRAGAWGEPFSGTPLRFTDLVVESLP